MNKFLVYVIIHECCLFATHSKPDAKADIKINNKNLVLAGNYTTMKQRCKFIANQSNQMFIIK